MRSFSRSGPTFKLLQVTRHALVYTNNSLQGLYFFIFGLVHVYGQLHYPTRKYEKQQFLLMTSKAIILKKPWSFHSLLQQISLKKKKKKQTGEIHKYQWQILLNFMSKKYLLLMLAKSHADSFSAVTFFSSITFPMILVKTFKISSKRYKQRKSV